MNFTDWCIDAGIEALTVFAFSTGGSKRSPLSPVVLADMACFVRLAENWKREKAEIDALMKLVDGFMHDILGEALTRNIRVRVLASDSRKLPAFLVKSIKEVEAKTQHCSAFHLNLCVRYVRRSFAPHPRG
jgi:undecaprenyl diphosphate synthase